MKSMIPLLAVCLLLSLPQLAAAQQKPRMIGVKMTVPIPVVKVEPDYTEAARKAKLEGIALVRLRVTNMGFPEQVVFAGWQSFNGQPAQDHGLREKALECVKRWRFQPATRDGKPVAMPAQIRVHFKLK